MNFRLSCTSRTADSIAPRPRGAEHCRNRPRMSVTELAVQTDLWDQLLPSSWLLPDFWCCDAEALTRKQHQGRENLFGVFCTSTEVFGVFLKMQLLKRKLSCFPRVLESGWEHCNRSRLADVSGSVTRCSSLPVSCLSLPVDDAKVRLFWAILRKWKILWGEIRGEGKASRARCAGATYSKYPEKPGDQFVPVLYLLTSWKVAGLEFMQISRGFKQTETCLHLHVCFCST